MTEIHTDILSAFCDGEIVDPELLAAALADSHGRAALIDFARLRAAVAPAGLLPASLGSLRRLPASAFAPFQPLALRRDRRFTGWGVTAAAAALLLLIVAAASLLPRTLFRGSADEAPPAPSRVVRYQPGVDWGPEERR